MTPHPAQRVVGRGPAVSAAPTSGPLTGVRVIESSMLGPGAI